MGGWRPGRLCLRDNSSTTARMHKINPTAITDIQCQVWYAGLVWGTFFLRIFVVADLPVAAPANAPPPAPKAAAVAIRPAPAGIPIPVPQATTPTPPTTAASRPPPTAPAPAPKAAFLPFVPGVTSSIAMISFQVFSALFRFHPTMIEKTPSTIPSVVVLSCAIRF